MCSTYFLADGAGVGAGVGVVIGGSGRLRYKQPVEIHAAANLPKRNEAGARESPAIKDEDEREPC